jgi:hypothetical protein
MTPNGGMNPLLTLSKYASPPQPTAARSPRWVTLSGILGPRVQPVTAHQYSELRNLLTEFDNAQFSGLSPGELQEVYGLIEQHVEGHVELRVVNTLQH